MLSVFLITKCKLSILKKQFKMKKFTNYIITIALLIFFMNACGFMNKKSMFSRISSNEDDNKTSESLEIVNNEIRNTLEVPLSAINQLVPKLPQSISLSPTLSMPIIEHDMKSRIVPLAISLATGGVGGMESAIASQFASMAMGGNMNSISPANLGAMGGSFNQIGGNMSNMALSSINPASAATSGAGSLLNAVDNIFGFSESHKQESTRVQGKEQRKTIEKQGQEQRKTIEKQGQEQRKTIRVAGEEKRKTVKEMGNQQRLTQDNAQKHRMSFLNQSAKHKKDIVKLQSKEHNKTIRLNHPKIVLIPPKIIKNKKN